MSPLSRPSILGGSRDVLGSFAPFQAPRDRFFFWAVSSTKLASNESLRDFGAQTVWLYGGVPTTQFGFRPKPQTGRTETRPTLLAACRLVPALRVHPGPYQVWGNQTAPEASGDKGISPSCVPVAAVFRDCGAWEEAEGDWTQSVAPACLQLWFPAGWGGGGGMPLLKQQPWHQRGPCWGPGSSPLEGPGIHKRGVRWRCGDMDTMGEPMTTSVGIQ